MKTPLSDLSGFVWAEPDAGQKLEFDGFFAVKFKLKANPRLWISIQFKNNFIHEQLELIGYVTLTSSFFLGSESGFLKSGESPYGEYASTLSCCWSMACWAAAALGSVRAGNEKTLTLHVCECGRETAAGGQLESHFYQQHKTNMKELNDDVLKH